ncbi:MAG: TonB-dependent receptor [Myxococcales bacterium]|nr:TonB-dependent receptor [Myxococcales bacterium]
MSRASAALGISVASALWLATAPARSQKVEIQAPAERRPVITPPRLLADSAATYPKRAVEDGVTQPVAVILILEIDATGKVTGTTVAGAGGHGFDEAASEAALRLRFEPARRGDTPVAAKIRFRYLFSPPPLALSGRVVDSKSGEPIAGAKILVRGSDGTNHELTSDAQGRWTAPASAAGRGRVSVTRSGYDEQQVPFELLPGKETVVAIELARHVEPEPAPAPDEVGVTVQGERPPPARVSMTRQEVRQLPGAFGDPFRAIEALPGVTPVFSGLPFFYVRGAPPGDVGYFLDGVRVPYLYHLLIGPSVVQPALVERVDLHPGGYPARFGRYAGGIVSAETTPPQTELHGEGNLRLFDAGAFVESGFAGGRGTVALGARYSYTAALLSAIAPDLVLDYRDFQARVSYDVTSRDRVTAFGFGAYDLLAQERDSGLDVLFGSEFYRLDLRHEHAFDSGSVATAVTLGYDQIHPPGTERNVTDRSIAARTAFRSKAGAGATLRGGADVALDAFRTAKAPYGDPDDPRVREFDETFPSRNDLVAGVWLDVVLDVTDGIEVVPGLRLDRYQSGSATAFAIDPRLSARFEVTPDLRLIHAYGIAHQPPAFMVPLPGLNPAGLEGGLQTAFQTSAGVEWDLPEDVVASVTLFNNVFFDMSDALGSGTEDEGPFTELDQRSLGSAYGLELYVRRRLTKKLGGLLSYTLSRSTRSFERSSAPSAFDRTHVVNAVLSYDLGRSWRAGTRGLFYTGTPVRDTLGGDVERNPPFYRIDLRFEKRWTFGKATWLSFVAEGMNVTLSKETVGDREIGPITIPSVGLEGGF